MRPKKLYLGWRVAVSRRVKRRWEKGGKRRKNGVYGWINNAKEWTESFDDDLTPKGGEELDGRETTEDGSGPTSCVLFEFVSRLSNSSVRYAI